MEKFAFIIHPVHLKRDVARKYPVARFLPEPLVEFLVKKTDPKVVSHITGIRSKTGAEAEGWFIACPLSPRQFLELDRQFVYDKIIRCGKIAEEIGAKIIGLGAFTSVVGDAGVTVAENLNIPVTTGNSYTVATAMEGLFEAARLMGVDTPNATAGVVGATGSIGQTCAQMLVDRVAKICLIGRNAGKLAKARDELTSGATEVVVSSDIEQSLPHCDLIVTVSSAVDAIIHPEYLKPGAVICDVARPRDVSGEVARVRDDVLIIEGGVVSVPGDVDFGLDFGFPPKTAYACMSETMMLALEGMYESFTLGRNITLGQIQRVSQLADKHGFRLAGFRSFEEAVTPERIESVRKNVQRGRTGSSRGRR